LGCCDVLEEEFAMVFATVSASRSSNGMAVRIQDGSCNSSSCNGSGKVPTMNQNLKNNNQPAAMATATASSCSISISTHASK